MSHPSQTQDGMDRNHRRPHSRADHSSILDISLLGPLDESNPVPLYVQLADKLSGAIRNAGEQAGGVCLPSENQCMTYFGISRPTVRQAMSELSAQGLIRRERGRGTFVNQGRIEHDLRHVFEDDMRTQGKVVTFQLLDSSRVDTPPWLGTQFGALGENGLHRVRRVRLLSGTPVSLEDRYIPATWAASLDEARILDSGSVLKVLRYCANLDTVQAINTVHSDSADKETASLLRAKTGTPVLIRDTWYHQAPTTPLMYSRVTFLGPGYRLRFESQIMLDKA